jgi:hypothetical protein
VKRRLRSSVVLRLTAVTAWAAVAVGTFSGFDCHAGPFTPLDRRIWMCVLAVALITTWAAIQTAAVAKFARSNRKLATAVLERPLNQTGPMLRAAADAALDNTGPHPAVSRPADLRAARRKRHGQPSTPR